MTSPSCISSNVGRNQRGKIVRVMSLPESMYQAVRIPTTTAIQNRSRMVN